MPLSPPSPPADITWSKLTPAVDFWAPQAQPVDVNYSFWTPVNAPILDQSFILDETRLK